MNTVVLYLNSSISLTVPILLAGIGVCFTEKAGVWGMNADSSMLIACFCSILTALGSGSPWIGILAGIFAGALTAWIFSLFSVKLGTDQTLTGLAFNFIVIGFTSSLMRLIWSSSGAPSIDGLGKAAIPVLSKIPVMGEILFDQPVLTYAVYFIIPVSWYVMFRTTWGLNIRSVGENPEAASSIGIHVNRVKMTAVTVGGAFCGLAGSVLAVQQIQTFTEEMTGARAWMGIIAAYFGGWSPLGASIAAFIFGLADALEMRVQLISFLNVSSYVIQMFPYVIALIVILFSGRNRRHPAKMGVHFVKQ